MTVSDRIGSSVPFVCFGPPTSPGWAYTPRVSCHMTMTTLEVLKVDEGLVRLESIASRPTWSVSSGSCVIASAPGYSNVFATYVPHSPWWVYAQVGSIVQLLCDVGGCTLP